MKMTMHIDEAILADVMALTGASSKTEAVELALRDLARRHRQRAILNEGLQLTPAQWDAEALPHPSDDLDAPDIDQDAVNRYLAATDPSRPRQRSFLGFLAEHKNAPKAQPLSPQSD
jgi:Arc/MetJ family transcription regulator